MSAGPYSRIYHQLQDEFPDVFDDAKALGTWTQLLVVADQTYPVTPRLPRKVHSVSLGKLVECELVTLLPGDRYRIKGQQKERERRSDAGRKGGVASGIARTTVERPLNDGSQPPGTKSNLEEKRRERDEKETSTTRASGFESVVSILPHVIRPEDAPPPDPDVARLQALAEELTQQPYVMANVHGSFGKKAVDEQLIPHGFDRVERAWRQITAQVTANGTTRPTLRQLVFGADEILNPVPSAKEIKAVDASAEEARRKARREENNRKHLEYLRRQSN